MPYTPGSKHGSSIKNPETLAYVAGLIDGEGTIGATVRFDRTKWVGIRLAIGMTDESMIRWLGEIFGGSVTCRKSKNSRQRDCWLWVVSQQKGAAILREVVPYLRLKRPQAELVIQLAESLRSGYNRWHPPGDEVVAERRAVVQVLRDLNRRGVA